MQPDTQMYHVRFKLLLYFRVTSGSQPTFPCILTGPIAAQIGQHKKKIKGLESLQHVTGVQMHPTEGDRGAAGGAFCSGRGA